ncbi:hypothetical protein [Gryllotalpicola protaetiae]|uniref:Lipoprotein n=1 Tax=Gryllotalpicola protaetiae TaxID=2419771 RepID=A0A387BMF9_9MICO|nr:hypothetical protein [Gryllotalpicola protaetiae]AYG02389.1 hypothetical protein D7I44_01790 [Gryllotalpicola protaetiae]
MRSRKITASILAAGALALTGCTQAHNVSTNLSRQADNFDVHRTVVVHDDITNTNIVEIQGLCSLDPDDSDKGNEHSVVCKIGKRSQDYVKEIFESGDNTTLTVIQTEAQKSDPFAYDIQFAATVPHFEIQHAGGDQ